MLVDAKISFHKRELSIHLDEFVLLLMELCKQRKDFPLIFYLDDDGDMQIRHTIEYLTKFCSQSTCTSNDRPNYEFVTWKASAGNNSRMLEASTFSAIQLNDEKSR